MEDLMPKKIIPFNTITYDLIRVVESESREVGKSLKIGKNRIKSEKSDLISYQTFWQKQYHKNRSTRFLFFLNSRHFCRQFGDSYPIYDFFPLCIFKCLLKVPASEEANPHWLHLCNFPPMCVFKCLLKLSAREDVKSHRLHLFDFSPLCVFKCVLKLPAWEDVYSHWLHLFNFSPLCVFKCAL